MKRIVFLVLTMFVVLSLHAQKPKVFIEYNNESEGWISMNLEKKENYEIVGNFYESNATIRVQMSQSAYKATGKIYVIDSYTKETLYTSKTLKGQSSAFNGYAPKKDLARKLVNDLEKNFDRKKINLKTFGKTKENESEDDKTKSIDDKYDKLKKLKELLDEGIITEEEFEAEKKKILENE